ncbi:MAG: NAD(P)/FAD-dependent oxidoreductase [Cyanobacteriota bacterium]|nr:NAD(P)/FAD-dependent oxidoreductase [Cyanobacteriota bacterium]
MFIILNVNWQESLRVFDTRLPLIVVGGGAAGFFAAIHSADHHPERPVVVLEASPQVLTKVRISGGGRCNVTHACFDPALLVQHYPRGAKALRAAFSRFQPRHTVEWFAQQGIPLKTEADGRMFPVTDQSQTIVDTLLNVAERLGVRIHTQAAVTGIHWIQSEGEPAAYFQVQVKHRDPWLAGQVLLATGSSPQGYRLAQSLGHTLVPPVPSLFTLQIADPRLRDLAGIALPKVRLHLHTADGSRFQQTGPILITHWGLSGPAVLKLSAWAARALAEHRYQATVQIDWLGGEINPEGLRDHLLAIKQEWSRRRVVAHTPLDLPERLWASLALATGMDPATRWAEISHRTLQNLVHQVIKGQFGVTGKGVFKEEFVTCGGIPLAEVDFKTMQSRRCPGLFFAGEILDIDGVTGGFNFQSAWTTGWLAAQGIAQKD